MRHWLRVTATVFLTVFLAFLWAEAVGLAVAIANAPSDIALLGAVLIVLTASAVGGVSFMFIWRREIDRCARWLSSR